MGKSGLKHILPAAFFLLSGTCCFAQSEDGRSDKDITIIQTATVVLPDCRFGDFSMPNAFTPNNDGYNDLFCVRGWETCISQFEVSIFSRAGEQVYESRNPSFCWDGKYKGDLLDTDVYVYAVKATFTNGLILSKTGNITLMR